MDFKENKPHIFDCADCETVFTTEEELDEHLKMHRPGNVDPEISSAEMEWKEEKADCNNVFAVEEILDEYLKQHNPVEVVPERSFLNSTELELKEEDTDHCDVRSKPKPEQNPHICAECKTVFKTDEHLQSHRFEQMIQETLQSEMLSLETTEQPSPSGGQFIPLEGRDGSPEKFGNYSVQATKTVKNIHWCDFCPRVFTDSERLRSHMVEHSSPEMLKNAQTEMTEIDVKPYLCHVCHEAFTNLNDFLHHQETVCSEAPMALIEIDNKPHVCDYCHEAFTDMNILASHKEQNEVPSILEPATMYETDMESDHCNSGSTLHKTLGSIVFENKDRFFCAKCNKVFFTKEDLNCHQEVHSSTDPHTTMVKSDKTMVKSVDQEKIPQRGKCISPEEQTDTRTLNKGQRCKLWKKSFNERRSFIAHMSRHGKKFHQCKLCNKSFGERRCFNAHVLLHRSKKVQKHMIMYNDGQLYQCTKCEKCFALRQHLKAHMATHAKVNPYNKLLSSKSSLTRKHGPHSFNKPYQCGQCGRRFLHETTLTGHLRAHAGLIPYQCDQCGKGFRSNSAMTNHLRKHSELTRYQCHKCDKAFTWKGNLTVHLRRHIEQPYQCSRCDKAFMCKRNYSKHIKTHVGKKPFKCDQCNRSFARIWVLARHLKLHSERNRYQCDQCNKAFRRKADWKVHRKIHGVDKPLQCDQCSKSFTRKHDLITHYRIHTGEKPYLYDQCDKAFSTEVHLNVHSRTEHGKTGTDPEFPTVESADPYDGQLTVSTLEEQIDGPKLLKRHRCELCNENFPERRIYDAHMLTHKTKTTRAMTNHHRDSVPWNPKPHCTNKPYQCDQCGRSFLTETTLTGHLRRHAGLRPYQCDHCDKAFMCQTELASHLRTHNVSDRPYQCKQCRKSFSKRIHLYAHSRTHTKRFNCHQEFYKLVAMSKRNLTPPKSICTEKDPNKPYRCG